ncbi:Coiled-coil and C2 domain-containing protein 2A [Gonapodya sp. JEL0774]|nr:Coiled-coil and C2 domain-containing protein 2A [Gonapodya sp. JEL0774]
MDEREGAAGLPIAGEGEGPLAKTRRKKARSDASLDDTSSQQYNENSLDSVQLEADHDVAGNASEIVTRKGRRKSGDGRAGSASTSTRDLRAEENADDRSRSPGSMSSLQQLAMRENDSADPKPLHPSLPPLPAPATSKIPLPGMTPVSALAGRARRMSRQALNISTMETAIPPVVSVQPAFSALVQPLTPIPPELSPLERARLRVQMRRASAGAGNAATLSGSADVADVLGYEVREATHPAPPPRASTPTTSARLPPRSPTPLAERLYASTHELSHSTPVLAGAPHESHFPPGARPSLTPAAMPFGSRRRKARAAGAAVGGAPTVGAGGLPEVAETSADSVVIPQDEDEGQKEYGGTMADLVRPLPPVALLPIASGESWAMEREGEGFYVGNGFGRETSGVRKSNVSRTLARMTASGWSHVTTPHTPLVLVLDLPHVQFIDHELMSSEHIAARILVSASAELRDQRQSSAEEWLRGRVEALRIHLKEVDGEGMDTARLRILQDLEIARTALHDERARTRELTHAVLKAWEEVKRIRVEQGFVATGVGISVRLGPEPGQREMEERDRELEDEVEERRFRWEADRDARMRRFRKRVAKYEGTKVSQDGLTSLGSVASIGGSENQLPHRTPKPPRLDPFDEVLVRGLVLNLLERGGTGARQLDVRVSEKGEVTPVGKCPKHEQVRRNRLFTSHRVQLRVVCNGKRVAASPERSITGATFGVDFLGATPVRNGSTYGGLMTDRKVGVDGRGSSTAPEDAEEERSKNTQDSLNAAGWVVVMQLTEVPASLALEIVEAGSVVGQVELPVPGPNETVGNVDAEGRRIGFVGGKIPLASGKTRVERRVTGEVIAKVMWGVGRNGESLGPGTRQRIAWLDSWDVDDVEGLKSAGMVRSRVGIYNIRKLVEWVSHLRLDPNNPLTRDLVHLRDLVTSSNPTVGANPDLASAVAYWIKRRFFRLCLPTQLERLTITVGAEWIAAKRIELCKLRWRNRVVVKGPLPGWDDAVTPDVWEKVKVEIDEEKEAADGHQRRISTRDQAALPHLSTSVLELATSRSHLEASVSPPPSPISQISLLKRVRAHHIFRQARLNRPSCVGDFVREEVLPPAEPLTISLAKYVRTRRPLNPERLERAKVAMPDTPSKCELVVQILRGFNIPVRKESNTKKSSGVNNGGANATNRVMPNETQSTLVRPYVEVHFQRHRARTVACEGPNPQWNETLSLPFIPFQNEFVRENLLETEALLETIYINLFDEVVVDLTVDERDKDKITHQRREKNWLGSVAVPFSFVYEQMRVDGVFPIKLPLVLLNYEKNRSAARENEILIGVDGTSETLLHLFITLEPPLARPEPLNLKFRSDESPKILEMCEAWKRRVRQSWGLLPDNKGAGRNIESWGRDSYVVVGEAVPEGRTAWVLVVDDRASDARASMIGALPGSRKASTVDGGRNQRPVGTRLYNPVTGELFETWEAHGGLQRVSYLFNNQNVWANVQTYDDPPRMSWNLADGKSWNRMVDESQAKNKWFGTNDGNRFWWAGLPSWKGKAEFRTIQASTLSYPSTYASFPRDLEILLHRTLTAKFESWRSIRSTTRWNRLISRTLGTFLPKLETDHLSGTSSGAAGLQSEIDGLQRTAGYLVRGFTLQQGWADVKSVVDAVWNTGCWEFDEEGVEFAMAVHCAGYPGGVVSVWVFVASVLRR